MDIRNLTLPTSLYIWNKSPENPLDQPTTVRYGPHHSSFGKKRFIPNWIWHYQVIYRWADLGRLGVLAWEYQQSAWSAQITAVSSAPFGSVTVFYHLEPLVSMGRKKWQVQGEKGCINLAKMYRNCFWARCLVFSNPRNCSAEGGKVFRAVPVWGPHCHIGGTLRRSMCLWVWLFIWFNLPCPRPRPWPEGEDYRPRLTVGFWHVRQKQ